MHNSIIDFRMSKMVNSATSICRDYIFWVRGMTLRCDRYNISMENPMNQVVSFIYVRRYEMWRYRY